MKKTRKLLSILLALVMALSLCTVAFAVDTPAVPTLSGTCGENIAWKLENGVLTVTGTGAIEPLVKQVWSEYANYVEGYDDPETGDWVDGYYEPGYVDQDYFPWEEDIYAAFMGLYGFEVEEDFTNAIMTGEIPLVEAYAEYEKILTKIVIGEGITSIADNAFDELQPAEIELPATLTTLGMEVFDLEVTTALTIKNAAFDFEENDILVWGAVGYPEIATASLEEYTAQKIADQAAFTTLLPFYYAIQSAYYLSYITAMIDGYAETYAEYVEQGLMTEEEAQGYLDEMAAQMINGIAEEMFPSFAEAVPESFDEAVAILLAFFNDNYGSDEVVFEGLEDIIVLDPETEDHTFGEKLAAAAPDQIAAVERVFGGEDPMVTYTLGTAPLKEIYDEEDEFSTVEITPVPWLTVYGPYNSTARTACATSQVKFVSFEEQEFDAKKEEAKAAADALAQDGDSDASKKLITDAKAAIDALEYDGTKTLDENKAAVDAINTKLAADLEAQRAADAAAAQPEEPTTEKPSGDSQKDEDGGYSNNAFMKFIKKIIEAIKDFFNKIFKK